MNIFKLIKMNISGLYNRYFTNIDEDVENLYYIAGSQTLPPPLSQDEEEKILERLEENDEEARKILVERNLRLVVYISKKFENTGIDIEDLISIGTIGLIKAINTFNVSKNIKHLDV